MRVIQAATVYDARVDDTHEVAGRRDEVVTTAQQAGRFRASRRVHEVTARCSQVPACSHDLDELMLRVGVAVGEREHAGERAVRSRDFVAHLKLGETRRPAGSRLYARDARETCSLVVSRCR